MRASEDLENFLFLITIVSLAPEHPFPTAVDDCFAAVKFVASTPEKFSASTKKGFLVGGSSAGGRLAAVISHLARDDAFFNERPVTGQLLHIPGVVHHSVVPEKSVTIFGVGSVLT